ncbi:hypothetical protein N8I77_013105 [Diaporthe amygdali]|uniref:Uncharacterized protein n=1 Tax=Phomopsis amygdali TaxID=1214568 RepID=A0AAD9VX29_PHOAM|nr:hypothetical protein N8I77_013105 [Diaporthe amygdali]
MESHQSQQQRGTRRGPGRPRGSSRAGRPSSSSGNHHGYGHSPVSLTNIINFGDSPSSINARTPSSSRGRVRGANHHTPSHPYISSPTSVDFPSVATDAMSLDDHRAASRSDKVPRQGLNHSFTFSTPENPRHSPGRKRARTLEYPTDGADHQDEAKVKGGHSLRKRVRIDYAQMNDDNEEDQPPKELHDDRTEITVSGARSARKRRSTADPHNDEEGPQPPSSAAISKRGRPEKQRTVSPKPQRRRTQQRKSISAPVARPAESPDQLPSDTELKDTIEVGAPLTMQFTGSSSSQRSETASNISGQSPSQNRNALQSTVIGAQVASPTMIQQEDEAATSFVAKEEPASSVLDATEPNHSEALPFSVTNEPDQEDVKEKVEDQDSQDSAPCPPDLGQQLTSALSAVSEIDNSQFAAQTSQDPEPAAFGTEMEAGSFQDHSQSLKVPSSQESIDSDATQDMPPDGPVGTSALARELRNTISSVVDEQPSEEPTKVLESDQQKEPVVESLHNSQNDQNDQNDQDTPNSLPRTRRRLGRLAGNSSATEEDSSQLPTQTERRASTSRKADKAKSDINPVASSVPTPESPETPKKRRPGRPPKIRQSIEQEPREPRVPRKRRVTAAAQTIAQPRPMRAHTPRDFSFLTPYTDAQDVYPEVAQDYGVPTPGETPNLQNSEDPGEPADDVESLAPERDSGSQEQNQSRLDGGTGSNAPTPAPMSDMPTPAAESMPASRNASPEPVIEPIRKVKARKQYAFTRIRSPTDFINVLDDYKNMSTEDLFNALEASANALGAWQEEWKKRKLVTEDEDNAVRRRAHDAALMAREARDMAKTNGAISVEKRDFEVKGIRANFVEENKLKHPESNPEVAERNQDQVAAQAYGFEWDPRPSMIGRQDPIGQRDGLQNNRLRNRPKLSQRAAEAAVDDPVGVVTGKRTRKPRILSDDSKEASRAPTPMEAVKPKQTRRRRKNAENFDSDYEAQAAADDSTPAQKPEVPEAPPPEQPVKKRRGPKPGAKAAREAAARAAAEKEAAEKAEQEAFANAEATRDRELYGVEDEQPQTRKRRRGAAADGPASSFDGANHQHQPYAESTFQQGGEPSLPAPKRQRNRKSAAATQVEIPPNTFYSAGSSVPTNDDTVTPTEDFRPSTSSSTSSMHTVGSNYSFRNRPRKNYSELADPIKDKLAETRPKRGRRAKKDQEPEPTSVPPNFSSSQFDGSSYGPPGHGYMPQQAASVLAPPNNPFINVTGGGPGQLLAPAPVRLGPAPAPPPHPVGAQNPFSAPHTNAPVEHPSHIEHPQSPRKKQPRIKIINRNRQNATPQPNGPPPPHQSYSHSGHQAPLAPLQPPPSFHGQTGYEPHLYGGAHLQPHSMPGAGPGQFSFPVNSSPHATMSMPPMMPNGPPFPPMGSLPGGPGSLPSTNSRGNSKPPGSGRATPAPSSAEGEDLSEKDYASMTKSEKMSASMKARWANGSMRQAVNKRKETLARKKQKQSDEKNPTKTSTPTPQPEMPPSQSRTPVTSSAPNLPPPATGGSAQPSPVDMGQSLPPQERHRDFGGMLMSGEYNGPPAIPGGIRAPSPPRQVPMQHDDRQVLGYMQDGPPPARMPLIGGIWEAHPRPYANGSGREEPNGDRHGGPGPAPGWGPQN